MQQEGPQLETLLRRLSECPEEFLEVAALDSGGVEVLAIVCDHLRAMASDEPPEFDPDLAKIQKFKGGHRAMVAVVIWLLHDSWFHSRPRLAAAMKRLVLGKELEDLAAMVAAKKLINDADRREELVRICLRAMSLRPQGESEVQAADRMTTLDSAERNRVLRATAKAERRARKVREAMARKAAQDAASRYGE